MELTQLQEQQAQLKKKKDALISKVRHGTVIVDSDSAFYIQLYICQLIYTTLSSIYRIAGNFGLVQIFVYFINTAKSFACVLASKNVSEIKNMKINSEGLPAIYMKICTFQNIPLYGISLHIYVQPYQLYTLLYNNVFNNLYICHWSLNTQFIV